MVSDNGHLVFTTGDNKEIRFQTSASGRVKVGNEDLTQLLSQVSFTSSKYSSFVILQDHCLRAMVISMIVSDLRHNDCDGYGI